MRILLHGASGRMGQMVEQKACGQVVCKVAADYLQESETEFLSLDHVNVESDVVIDFSNHVATEALMNYCVAHQLPVVVCTTAQTKEEKEMIYAAAKSIPVFFSANMSMGVAVVTDLARRAAAMFPDADIEIVEKHHNQKLDVPSGTALMIANAIKDVRQDSEFVIGRHTNGKREKKEIGIHSLRLGNEVGTHEIIIATGNETITITHEAESRALFADGALKAAEFILDKEPGLYNMASILG